MTARQRLPDRRPSTIDVVVIGLDRRGKPRELQIGVGYDRDGQAREVFLNGLKVGSDTEALLQDACVVISLALQHGLRPADLAGSLGRAGVAPNAPFASLIGLVAQTLKRAEAADLDSPESGG